METGAQFTILYKREFNAFRQGKAEVAFDKEPPVIAQFGAMLLLNKSVEIRTRTFRSITMNDEADLEPDPFFRDAGSVSFFVPREIKVAFALPDHARALKALGECATRLGVEWGYPVEEQARLAKPAKRENGLRDLFSPNDYPARRIGEARWGVSGFGFA